MKKKKAETKKTVRQSALKKKIGTQLAGLDLFETLLHDLVRAGLGAMNPEAARQLETQAKQLRNAYLPGVQNALRELANLFSDKALLNHDAPESKEAFHTEALDRLVRLHALCRHGRSYLAQRLEDPDLAPDTDSTIAELLGHVWQLRELGALGRVQEKAELIQLAFNACNDTARREFVETGIWVNMATGHIQLTRNFRPYRAARHIREDDAVFDVVQTEELFIYPGHMNPRIRWQEMTRRPLKTGDYAKIRSFARTAFAPVIRAVRNQLKSPLSDRYPLALLSYRRIGRVSDHLVMEDTGGERLVLEDVSVADEPETCSLFPFLPADALKNQVLLGRFHYNLMARTLRVKPLSIVTGSEILRLTF